MNEMQKNDAKFREENNIESDVSTRMFVLHNFRTNYENSILDAIEYADDSIRNQIVNDDTLSSFDSFKNAAKLATDCNDERILRLCFDYYTSF